MFSALENSLVLFLLCLKTEGEPLKPAYWMPRCISPSSCGMWRQVMCSMLKLHPRTLKLHPRTLATQDTELLRADMQANLFACVVVKYWTLKQTDALLSASHSLSEDLPVVLNLGPFSPTGPPGNLWRQFWSSRLGCNMPLTSKGRGQGWC